MMTIKYSRQFMQNRCMMTKGLIAYAFILGSVLNPFGLLAQDEEVDDPLRIEDLVTVPKTPEAWAFQEYANSSSVSHYTGKASISIPIDGLQGRKMSHPVSLTYQTGGIRVQQEAGLVGLGWNLNVGGMITRNVNGLPDDYNNADWPYYPFYSDVDWNGSGKTVAELFEEYQNNNYVLAQPLDSGYVQLYRNFRNAATSLREIETQPDTYSFNVGGLSGTLFIDYTNNTAYCIEHPDLKVVVNFSAPVGHGVKEITKWTLTDNQGTVYLFDKLEKTRVQNDGSAGGRMVSQSREYTSGWYVSSISNSYFKDTFTFQYTAEISTSSYSMPGVSDTREESLADAGSDATYCGTTPSFSFGGVMKYSYKKKHVEKVLVNGVERIKFDLIDGRTDLPGQKMVSKIEVKNLLGELINTVDLINDGLFGQDPATNPYESRLKLDAVKFHGADPLSIPQVYSFEYDLQPMPRRDSYAQDYWGFYNGADDNSSLIPRNSLYDDALSDTGNRNANALKMQAGSLIQVNYPTGGSTSYSYGANLIEDQISGETTVVVGSLSLTGGTYPDDPYGYYECDDASGAGAPKISTTTFRITEEDTYKVKVSVSPTNPTNALQAIAIKAWGVELCDLANPDEEDFVYLEQGTAISDEVNVTLAPGGYEILLLNDQSTETIGVEVSHVVQSSSSFFRPVGGLRVNKKEDWSDEGVLAMKTYYYYDDITEFGVPSEGVLENNYSSSAVLHHLNMFEMVNNREVLTDEGTGKWECEYLTRSASNMATPTPNILSYSTVSEVMVDANGNLNGARVLDFYNKYEGVQNRPFSKTEALNGMVKLERTFRVKPDTTFEQLTETYNVYEKVPLGNGVTGFDFNSVESKYLDVLLELNVDDSDMARVYYKAMNFTGKHPNPPRPVPCIDENAPSNNPLVVECWGNNKSPLPIYEQRSFGVSNYWLRQVSSTNKQWENGDELSTTSQMGYGNDHFQITDLTNEYANGLTEKWDYLYAQDVGNQTLLNENRVAEKLEINRSIDNEVISKKVIEYNGGSKPFAIKVGHKANGLSADQNLEERLKVFEYDADNNIIKLRGTDGLTKHYVWGYEGHLLVAEIVEGKNEYSQTNEGVVEPILDTLTFDADGDHALSTSVHNTLNSLPYVQASIYTHDPGRGMTSVTGPTSRSTYYHYDNFGRLYQVKDQEGNILSENVYHFADQTLTLPSGCVDALAPSAGYNYIRSITARDAIDAGCLSAETDKTKVIQSVSYVDGLGRPLQQIAVAASPQGYDWVSGIEYDGYGRKTKDFMPYAASSDVDGNQNSIKGSYRSDWNNEQKLYLAAKYNVDPGDNHEDYGFSEQILEASPRSRAFAQAAPGETWSKENGSHLVEHTYLINTAADNIPNVYTKNGQIIISGFYTAGQLNGVKVQDENNGAQEGVSITWTDKAGQTVLKETRIMQGSVEQFARTLYGYDLFGNLSFVVQPEGVKLIEEGTHQWSDLNDPSFQQLWMFMYKFDSRQRMIAKQVPGAETVEMVYDDRDRLVMTLDGNRRQGVIEYVTSGTTKVLESYEGKSYIREPGAIIVLKNPNFRASKHDGFSVQKTTSQPMQHKQWLYTKYDVLNRPVMTGIKNMTEDWATVQGLIDGQSNYEFGVDYTGESTSIHGYNDTSYPQATGTDVLTVTYYDNYNFVSDFSWENDYSYANHFTGVTNLTTGGLVKLMDNTAPRHLKSVTYYDERLRPVAVMSENYFGKVDESVSTYYSDVSSLVANTTSVHRKDAAATTVLETFDYDHQDRLLSHKHAVVGNGTKTLSSNTYSAIGELIQKNFHNNTNPVQSVNYQYNQRGWLSTINGGTNNLGSGDQFGLELKYEDAPNPQYNGNIGQMLWVAKGGGENENEQFYQYSYDAMSRLINAEYGSTGINGHFTVGGISYDVNGNLISLTRREDNIIIDELDYYYSGNQLTQVEDNRSATKGFLDLDSPIGTIEYTYDHNGNMIKDANKGITNVQYNHLDLPMQVILSDGRVIRYIYDAAGVKHAKIVLNGTLTPEESVYAGAFHYQMQDDGTGGQVLGLAFLQHAEGRARYNSGSWHYEYNLTDHLGNVRVSVNESDSVVQRDGYYPFGGTFNHWSTGTESLYKYNNKEEQKEWGLYHYGARYYDPWLARFPTQDRFAEKYYSHNPYHYVMGNPINAIDINGDSTKLIGWNNWVGDFNDRAHNAINARINDPSLLLDDLNTISGNILQTLGDLTFISDATGNENQMVASIDSGIETLLNWNNLSEEQKGAVIAAGTTMALMTLLEKKIPSKGSLTLKSIAGKSFDGNATAIGRMDVLKKYDNVQNVDTWRKSGRIPGPGGKPVTWQENRIWLQNRIDRGDTFIMTMNPKNLPTQYVPGKPNGWFTKLEYDYLVKKGATIIEDY